MNVYIYTQTNIKMKKNEHLLSRLMLATVNKSRMHPDPYSVSSKKKNDAQLMTRNCRACENETHLEYSPS